MGKKLEDLTGRTYGRLVILGDSGERKHSKRLWTCKCTCGTIRLVPTQALKSGNTTSCGCYRIERITKHGMSYSRVYRIWDGMLQRCTNSNHTEYANYGGRGISVCDSWKDFMVFLADMGESPEGLSLDRIDVNGNYEPSNCKWSTSVEQANNKRTNKILEYNGEKLTLSQWAKKLSINYSTLSNRISTGWTIEKALTTKVRISRGI